MMDLASVFPIWEKLTPAEQKELQQSALYREVPADALLHNGQEDCVGLMLLCSGQLRAYRLSPQGKEITLYRLLPRDICLFSASCMMQDIQFDLVIRAEKDSALWLVPPDVYRRLMETSLPVAQYTNQVMASRLSQVMWLMEQILWQKFDRRLAEFLLEESLLEDSLTLRLTHDKIAAHLGTAREVVTRMLRYFQEEGLVHLHRGGVELLSTKALSDYLAQPEE